MRQLTRPARRLTLVVLAAAPFLLGLQSPKPASPQKPATKPATKPASPPAQKPPPATAAKPPSTHAAQQASVASTTIMKPWTGDFDGMLKRRYIRVATTYNRTHYFIDRGVQRGLVYEAFKIFEDEINAVQKTKNLRVNVVFIPMSREALLPAVAEGRADIAAAALTITDERKKLVDFSPPTMTGVDEIVVTGPSAPAIATVDDLSGQTVFLRATSSYASSVRKLNEALKAKGKAPVVIKEAPETLEDEDILEMVNAGLVKISIVDSYMATFWKQLLPQLAFRADVAVAKDGQLGAAIRKNSPLLMTQLAGWIKRHGEKTMFGNMMVRRYLESTKMAKSATTGADLERFQKLVELFRKYGEKYELDAVLMAAQGFQESGLDQSVKSKVGAVGVMQVMPATGKELAVGDISQVEPNIHAGIKYIRFMIDQYFKDEPMDRLNKGLFAFASYNAGPGRVRQLRREAEKRGLDPNVWFNNVERIASERIGRETVTYVSNIYKYYIAYRLVLDERAERSRDKGGSGADGRN